MISTNAPAISMTPLQPKSILLAKPLSVRGLIDRWRDGDMQSAARDARKPLIKLGPEAPVPKAPMKNGGKLSKSDWPAYGIVLAFSTIPGALMGGVLIPSLTWAMHAVDQATAALMPPGITLNVPTIPQFFEYVSSRPAHSAAIGAAVTFAAAAITLGASIIMSKKQGTHGEKWL